MTQWFIGYAIGVFIGAFSYRLWKNRSKGMVKTVFEVEVAVKVTDLDAVLGLFACLEAHQDQLPEQVKEYLRDNFQESNE